jgi:succinate dehydrogenase / fumarate reductase cytochrome b subunit
MKYAFYPGCVSQGGCPELYPAVIKVADKLGFELVEMEDVGCTGAGVLSREVSDPINARTFAKAEAMGMPIMTICSTCQGVMTQANHRLKDLEYREMINREYLAEEGLEYKGTIDIRHMLWAIVEDYGLDKLKELVVRPLNGLPVAQFYGCYLKRPPELMLPKEFAKTRKTALEDVIEALGGVAVKSSGRGKCCGFPILTSNEANSLSMCGDHILDAKAKGAKAMVTPCPLCHLELDGKQADAAAHKGQEINIPVLHLPQLVGLAMGFSSKEMNLQRHLVSTKPVEERLGLEVKA